MHKDSMGKDILTLLEENRSGGCSICNGNGFGDGRGNSNGFGDGYGLGDGTGSSFGDGNGWGWGYGNDNGNGWGNEWGWGYGNDNGSGDGNGWGWGNSKGNGNGGSGIAEINGMKVYVIDDMPTVIETVFGTYAKGYTIGCSIALTPCYIAMDGSSFAHGKTLKEAFCDARAKEMEKLPVKERVKCFVTEHQDPGEILPNAELFYIHHTLTGSCEFGRREFCYKNNIDLESSMSISEFLCLTENEYGGEVIRKIREEYLRWAEPRNIKTPTFTP